MTAIRYTKDHEWVRQEGDIAVIGITDYAQSQLGDVVYVDMPKVGAKAVITTHIGPSIDPNDDYQRYVTDPNKYLSGPITLAKDLMRF